jgi:aspartate aminotransferase-like enzyme
MSSRLLTPGPTPVPDEAAEAMAAPLIHHRTAEFKALLKDTRVRLAKAFRTDGEVAILTSSGSGGMEAAVVGLCAPGQPVLVASTGRFGDRWAQIAAAYGLTVVHETCPVGESFAVDRFERLLKEKGPFQTAFVTVSESSTGARTDVEAIAAITRRTPTLLVADAITALGAIPVEVERWGIDAAVGASQKAFGVPPGLAFVAVAGRALERLKGPGLPRFYFNLSKEIARQKDGETAFTPAIPQVAATCAVLRKLDGPAFDAQLAATAERARAVRAAAAAMDLATVTRQLASDALTALWLPNGIDGSALVKDIETRTGLRFAGGQGDLKGRIVRIAHLGFVTQADTIAAIGALEGALRRCGAAIPDGRGVAAALAVFEGRGARGNS